MLTKQIINKNGFRSLTVSELETVSGGDITVIGTPPSPPDLGGLDPLALIDFQNLQQQAAIMQTLAMFQGTTQEAPGDDGGTSQFGQFSREMREEALEANQDSEKQEAVENFLESVMEQANPGKGDWVFEYNGDGQYVGLAADGTPVAFEAQGVEADFDRLVA